MWTLTIIISFLLAERCSGIYLVDLPTNQQESEPDVHGDAITGQRRRMPAYPPLRSDQRQYVVRQSHFRADSEKDLDIKKKIATLVQQTVHDTDRKIKSIQNLKTKHRNQPPYKIGFILNMIKKARDVLNELFNVAVKHRDEWKALEQLKIFELIVHTNVDTTNLVRQLVEIHVQYLNATNGGGGDKKRVVLL